MLLRVRHSSVWPFFISISLFLRSIAILLLRSRIQWIDIPQYSIKENFILNLFEKLFSINVEGLGWKIISYASVIFIPLFFWFKENRYQYKDFLVREVDTNQFYDLSHDIKVELRYGSELTSPEKKIWIFGSKSYPSKVSLFEFDSNSNTHFKWHYTNWEKKSYKQIINNIKLDPETFVAFNLLVPEGLPEYKVKIEMNGMTSWINIHDQFRYSVPANNQNRIRFKQTFISFLKSKITK